MCPSGLHSPPPYNPNHHASCWPQNMSRELLQLTHSTEKSVISREISDMSCISREQLGIDGIAASHAGLVFESQEE